MAFNKAHHVKSFKGAKCLQITVSNLVMKYCISSPSFQCFSIHTWIQGILLYFSIPSERQSFQIWEHVACQAENQRKIVRVGSYHCHIDNAGQDDKNSGSYQVIFHEAPLVDSYSADLAPQITGKKSCYCGSMKPCDLAASSIQLTAFLEWYIPTLLKSRQKKKIKTRMEAKKTIKPFPKAWAMWLLRMLF